MSVIYLFSSPAEIAREVGSNAKNAASPKTSREKRLLRIRGVQSRRSSDSN